MPGFVDAGDFAFERLHLVDLGARLCHDVLWRKPSPNCRREGLLRLPRGPRRRTSVAAGLKLEPDFLPLAQRTESRQFDSGDVDESVFRAVLRLDEPVALGRVEPLHGSSWHGLFLQLSRRDCKVAGAARSLGPRGARAGGPGERASLAAEWRAGPSDVRVPRRSRCEGRSSEAAPQTDETCSRPSDGSATPGAPHR